MAPWSRLGAQVPPTPVVEPDDGRGPVLELIDSSQSSLDVAIYELSDRRILAALEGAARRGVQVRVLAEPMPGGRPANDRALTALRQVGVQTHAASPRFRLTHEKAIVADGAVALIMTFNLDAGSFTGDRDVAILDGDAGDVAEIEAVFQADWDRQPVAPSRPSLVWSPDNSRSRLAALLAGATVAIDCYVEELVDPGMIAALQAAASNGVQVRLLMTDRGSRDTSRNGRAQVQAAGAEVRLLHAPFVHAKLILVDGVLAFAGSQNLSVASLDQNRELGILTGDATTLARLASVFEQDWQRALPSP